MNLSYHNPAEDLREDAHTDDFSWREQRAEAPAHLITFRKPLSGETGLMPQLILETSERIDERETNSSTSEMRAYRMQETTMSENAPVLIIEDTVELAEVIEATIHGMGLPTLVANHGSVALKHLTTHTPRLVLLDLGLPDISGWEILKTVKELYRDQGKTMPPIIVITALADPTNRLVGKFQEVHAYLIKPFTPDQIEQTINGVLSGDIPAPI